MNEPAENVASISQELLDVAQRERNDIRKLGRELQLAPDIKVSLYLFQPVLLDGIPGDSKGTLVDFGPIPAHASDEPELLYTCALAGKAGKYFSSAANTNFRIPLPERIGSIADIQERNPKTWEATIRAESLRHDMPLDADYREWFQFNLAIAVRPPTFGVLQGRRLPTLGVAFVVLHRTLVQQAAEDDPGYNTVTNYAFLVRDSPWLNALVDYSIVVADEMLDIRARHLLGAGQDHNLDRALKALVESPTGDDAVQLVMKFILSHHWFYAHQLSAYWLFQRVLGDDVGSLYETHGWLPPPNPTKGAEAYAEEVSDAQLLKGLIEDATAILTHQAWRRLARPRRLTTTDLSTRIENAVQTALLLLIGEVRHSPGAARDRRHYLAAPENFHALAELKGGRTPVFDDTTVGNLSRKGATFRSNQTGEDVDGAVRLSSVFTAVSPESEGFQLRTHFQARVREFVYGYDPYHRTPQKEGSTPSDLASTRWITAYAAAKMVATLAKEHIGRKRTPTDTRTIDGESGAST